MKKINLESFLWRVVEMSKECLTDLQEVLKLLETLSRKNQEKDSALMKNMDTFILAQPILVLA